MKAKKVLLEMQDKLTQVGRTKNQRNVISNMISRGQLTKVFQYIESFNGNKSSAYITRYQSDKKDLLREKKPGSMLKLFDQMMNTKRQHVPNTNESSWIGIEIECCIPYSSVGIDQHGCGQEACSHCDGDGYTMVDDEDEDGNSIEVGNGCHRCEGSGIIESDEGDSETSAHSALTDIFRNEKVIFSNIKGDGSIDTPNDDYFAVEVTILTRLDKPTNLKKVCAILDRLGAKVNKSCGMHIHLDARSLNSDKVLAIGKKFKAAMPALATLVPKTRRTNEQYCKLGVSKLRGSRYYACNLTAFSKYNTIEIRLHSSTTDFDKIIQWAKLMFSIMKADSIKKCHNLNDLTEYVNIDQDTMEYFSQREALFAEKNDIKVNAQDLDSTDSKPEAQLTLDANYAGETIFGAQVSSSLIVRTVNQENGIVTFERVG